MTMRKCVAILMMASILLGGCGTTASTEATTASTEVTTASTEATTASTEVTTASTEVTTASTEASTAETAPNQTTTVVWLEKGDVIVIEEYNDHYTVSNAEGSVEYPNYLPRIEESKCEYSELPDEWQEALTR